MFQQINRLLQFLILIQFVSQFRKSDRLKHNKFSPVKSEPFYLEPALPG